MLVNFSCSLEGCYTAGKGLGSLCGQNIHMQFDLRSIHVLSRGAHLKRGLCGFFTLDWINFFLCGSKRLSKENGRDHPTSCRYLICVYRCNENSKE